MTLKEACELAQAIEGNGQFAVIAIGRFVMTDELSSLSKQTLPWSVSVVSLSDRNDRTVIREESEWIAFAKGVSQSHTTEPVVAATAKRPPIDEHQLELF